MNAAEFLAVPVDWRVLIAGAAFCAGISFFAAALLAYRVLRIPLTWRSAARYAAASMLALVLAIALSSAYAAVAPGAVAAAMLVSLAGSQWWVAGWHLRHERRRPDAPQASTAELPSWRLAGVVLPVSVLLNAALGMAFMAWLISPSIWRVTLDAARAA